MQIDVLTLFPDMLTGPLNASILKRAQEKGKFNYNLINFRDYTEDKHEKVDDYPYGGGAGMVLTPQPVFDAVAAITKDKPSKPRILLMCLKVELFNQTTAVELSERELLF